MKRILYMIIGVTLLLTGCDKEYSDNGHLDGFWQLTLMQDKASGTVSDKRSSGITWSFQGHILELRDVRKEHQDLVMSFTREGSRLTLSAPYRVDRDLDDVALEDADLLIPYGINSTVASFTIIELPMGRMVSSDQYLQYEFRQY